MHVLNSTYHTQRKKTTTVVSAVKCCGSHNEVAATDRQHRLLGSLELLHGRREHLSGAITCHCIGEHGGSMQVRVAVSRAGQLANMRCVLARAHLNTASVVKDSKPCAGGRLQGLDGRAFGANESAYELPVDAH